MAPVAGRVGWLLGHGGHDPQSLVVVVDQGPARPLAVLQAGQSFGLEAAPPPRDGVLVHAHHGDDLTVGTPSAASSTIRARSAARCGVGTDPAVQLGAFGIGDRSGGTVGIRRLLMLRH
jgi:hypothetical protein